MNNPMGVRERHEREREAIRQTILDAARELFVSDGYRNVSIRKVAERIEYSPAAIYNYFSRKNDLYMALAEEGFRLLAAREDTAVAGAHHPLEILRRCAAALYAFAKEHRQYFQLMFLESAMPGLGTRIRGSDAWRASVARSEAAIRACVGLGLFAPALDARAGRQLLWAGIAGVVALAEGERGGPGVNADALAQDLVEAMIAGFAGGAVTTSTALARAVASAPLDPESRSKGEPAI